MSGGSYDYMYSKIEWTYIDQVFDDELNDMLKDLVNLLKSLEWWQSCDTSEEDYIDDLKKFKNKWFKKYNKELCYTYCPHKELTKQVKNVLKIIKSEEE